MTLINAMRADFPVVDPDSTLAAAASRFGETGYCSLPVVDQGRLIGVLDSLDVAARAVNGGLDPTHALVRHLMRGEPVSCGPTTPLDDARRLMLSERVNTLFVVESGLRLVGVIDLIGLLKAAEAASSAGPELEWNQRVRGEA